MLLTDRLALRITEAAKVLGVSERTVHDLISNEGLPVVRTRGKLVLIPVDSLRRWLADRAQAETSHAEKVDRVMREMMSMTGSRRA